MSFKPSKECVILAQSNCSSQLNNSISKQSYSFSKNPRFDKDSEKSQIMLGQSTMDSSKGPKIGTSNRYDFTNNIEQQLNPAPNKYTIEGEFDKLNKKAVKGFSLALGREKILACNQDFKVPGPGRYQNEKIYKSQPKYSMAPKNYASNIQKIYRFLEGKSIIYQQYSPAPDNYTLPNSIDPVGKYQLSNYRGSRAPVISSPTEKKVKYQKVCPPGPGAYEQADMKREKGILQYYEAKFKSYQGQSFGSARKTKSLPKIKSPGPGQYSMPSEFGVPLSNFPIYNSSNRSSRKSSIVSRLYEPVQKKLQGRRPKPKENEQKPINSLLLGKYLPPIIKDIST